MEVAQASREDGRGKAEPGSITVHPLEVSLGPGSPAMMGLGLPFLQVLGTQFSSITSGICLLQAWLRSGAWDPGHSLPSADPKTCMAGSSASETAVRIPVTRVRVTESTNVGILQRFLIFAVLVVPNCFWGWQVER